MTKLNGDLSTVFFEGLKEYIRDEKEEYLSKAYERGRKLVQEGYSELDIVALHHKMLVEVKDLDLGLDYEEKINRASAYLNEWLAPFELKLDSYRDAIAELRDKNERLQEEIKSRQEAQRELSERKEYFQSLIENARDIITVLDHQGIIRFSSPAIKQILGYEQGELTGKCVFDQVHENDIEHTKERFKEVLSSPDKVVKAEFRFQHKDGSWVYFESLAKNIEQPGEVSTVIVNSRDFTERKKAIDKLREHEYQLSQAQKIAKVGSWHWLPSEEGEGEVRWSEQMARIFGLKPGEFDNSYQTYLNYIHPDDRGLLRSRIEKALEEKSDFVCEHRIELDDGSERSLLCRGEVITDEDGDIAKMIGTAQDITEQREREYKLKEYSERLRKLSERIERAREEERVRIARRVHDELGQMLTVLKMDVSMVRGEMQKKVTDATLQYFNSQARKILNRINTIIKSVQRITTELRPEVLDDLGLKEAIDWQAGEFEKRSGVEVSFSSNIGSDASFKEEHSTTLFRIFQETLTNISRHADATEVDIELNRKDGNLFLSVKDDGVGITEEQKEASSSLGIIGMRERTRFLGGDVDIKGEKGKGTEVTLRIPIENDEDKS